MNNQICYYENKIADKLQKSIAVNVVYKESKNFPRIQIWNKYTAEIPSIIKCPDEFKKYYFLKVVDQDVLNDLEDEKIINAVQNLTKLYPIQTPSDGNCLCHAVSQYMWGIPDRRNFLRQLLYVTLATDENKLLQRLYMQHVANEQFSVENFSSGIWNKQWDRLVLEAQETPINSSNTRVEPLEAIHIFILANILLRPIIVLSSPVVRTVFNHSIQTNNIGGIYLPLLCNPNDTVKSPIVLGFHMNHFTPLIFMENSIKIKAIPLKRMEAGIMPLHFSQDLLPNSIAKKLQTYLDIDTKTESALIKQVPLPKDHNMFFAHLEHCKTLYDNSKQPKVGKTTIETNDQMIGDKWNEEFLERHSETIHIIFSSQNKSPSFCINNCGMYGSVELGNKCSKCFAKNSDLSDRIPQRSAKQEVRVMNEAEFGQNTHEQFQLAPAKDYKPSVIQFPQKKTQEISMRDYQHKQPQPFLSSLHDSHPTEFSNSKESQDESTQFIPISQLMDQRLEEYNLETATCITPGCHLKAHRKLQYRCASCFIERNMKSKDTDFSPHSENSPGAVANSVNLSPIRRTQISTHEASVSTEERQVSLLDLLCSEDNCPNRRISPLNSLCSSCSEKNGKWQSSPGEQQENRHAMYNDCFRNKELKRLEIPTQRNTINHTPDPKIYNVNHDHLQPSAPSFQNEWTNC